MSRQEALALSCSAAPPKLGRSYSQTVQPAGTVTLLTELSEMPSGSDE